MNLEIKSLHLSRRALLSDPHMPTLEIKKRPYLFRQRQLAAIFRRPYSFASPTFAGFAIYNAIIPQNRVFVNQSAAKMREFFQSP